MICTIKNNILIINFKGDKRLMNNILDPISNSYEGFIIGRIAHNFPSDFIPNNHFLYKYKSICKYVVGFYKTKDLTHELLHAKYYLEPEYRKHIQTEWDNLDSNKRYYLESFLKKLGYNDNVIIDEYQAYRYSEKNNFFGIKL